MTFLSFFFYLHLLCQYLNTRFDCMQPIIRMPSCRCQSAWRCYVGTSWSVLIAWSSEIVLVTEFSLARPTESIRLLQRFSPLGGGNVRSFLPYTPYSVCVIFYVAAQPLSQWMASWPGLGGAYIVMALMAPTVSIFHSVGLNDTEYGVDTP